MPDHDMIQFQSDPEDRRILHRVAVAPPEDEWPPPERIYLVEGPDHLLMGVFLPQEMDLVADHLTDDAPQEFIDALVVTPCDRHGYSKLTERAEFVMRGAVYCPA